MAFDIERFIAEDHFILCPPIPADNFVALCKECDLRIERETLEMLEREKVFYPLLRARFPKYTEKISRLDNGYQSLGPLQEGESWGGEIHEAYGVFYFEKQLAEEFYHEGLLWRPQDRLFEPWHSFWNEDGQN